MTAYVHIGTGKTGTSTLQAFFDKNQESLKHKKLVYPSSRLEVHKHVFLDYMVVRECKKAF
ncbi:hypothetical protein [uncultured Campylobacter sp.]|uniref:hypothetical protein n=1 Tax=uncultured Campylobacter sp. TaxID=218934 RepID=UPI00261959DB|nr:hypothetical protein [uncultured Campylobacter sp.]